MNITPPKEIDILECLRVDFSIFPLQKDIEKIERSVFRKKVTVLEIEHYLLGFEEKLKAASPEVLSDLAKSAPFKRICLYLDEIRSNRPLHVGIKRSKSDVSCMKNVKTVRGCKKRNAILKSHSFHYKTSVLWIKRNKFFNVCTYKYKFASEYRLTVYMDQKMPFCVISISWINSTHELLPAAQIMMKRLQLNYTLGECNCK